MDGLYCTLAELYEDLKLDGVRSEAALLKHVRAASQYITSLRRSFIPVVETRSFRGKGGTELLIPPLLSITSVTNDGTTLTAGVDFEMWPDGRHWRNGPYSALIIPSSGSTIGSWSRETEGVVISGEWGLWDEAVSLQLSAVSQLVGDTTLVVSNGSQISPGMVIRIEDELELVTETGSATDSTANLITAIDVTDEELSVINGSLLSAGEVIRIGFERMQVLEVIGNDVQVSRGYMGSKRAAHLAGADIYVHRTYTVQRGANGSTAAAHSSKAVTRQVAPEDVNYLCRQIAALMKKKADTGFIGRSGNDDLGTGFWVNEFPKNQVEAVMENYVWGGR
jgi:hypothetical protein